VVRRRNYTQLDRSRRRQGCPLERRQRGAHRTGAGSSCTVCQVHPERQTGGGCFCKRSRRRGAGHLRCPLWRIGPDHKVDRNARFLDRARRLPACTRTQRLSRHLGVCGSAAKSSPVPLGRASRDQSWIMVSRRTTLGGCRARRRK
jgi:hypothetical protein